MCHLLPFSDFPTYAEFNWEKNKYKNIIYIHTFIKTVNITNISLNKSRTTKCYTSESDLNQFWNILFWITE